MQNEKTSLLDVILCALLMAALGLGLAWAF
jgi:hypothetical protein